ncbi:copper resistance CopC family protein [Gephyromycinifex aptenodytis]|uniref:copper resistance CopC family protein n=1 Tax=Gephyromycinifex aptenodytis TaxID=2716227 RepID=UPI001448601D|nr:copper resistance CopC family protein [Gephyromycinifex aptenodytis]
MPTPPAARVRPSIPVRAILTAVLVTVLAGAGLLVGSWTAQGHAQLVSSSPADGDTVATPPAEASLTFNEEINPKFAQIVVADPSGRAVPVEPQVENATVVVPLPTDLPAGKIAVRYRVVSRDGHPIAGQIAFTQEKGAAVSSAPQSSAPSAPAGGPIANPSPDVATMTETNPAGPTESDGSIGAIYVLTGVAALALIGVGALLFFWERRRQ